MVRSLSDLAKDFDKMDEAELRSKISALREERKLAKDHSSMAVARKEKKKASVTSQLTKLMQGMSAEQRAAFLDTLSKK